MVYRMTVWRYLKSRLRGGSLPHATDAPESHLPSDSGAPFDTWSNLLLFDKCMLVVTEEGIFERVRTGRWILHRPTGPWVTFGGELPDLTLFLEQETFHTYKQRIQEINHQ